MSLIKINFKKQMGASLIEILIGLSISLIIVVAVLGLFTSTFTASQRILERGKLDRDLYSIMDIIVSDIQRAGYWTNATTSNSNPFMNGTDNITPSVGNNCVTFTYDTNANSTVDDVDRMGYGLNSSAIKFRQSGSTFDCASIASWTNLTDPNVITITAFTVTYVNTAVDIDSTNPGTGTTNYRKVTISITGNLTNAPDNTKTLSRTIKIYNNKYLP